MTRRGRFLSQRYAFADELHGPPLWRVLLAMVARLLGARP